MQGKSLRGPVVLIRGAGEMASGVGWTLAKAGYRVLMTETEHPLMVRWPVSFGTAVHENDWEVEGITATRVKTLSECHTECEILWQQGRIPVVIDPDLNVLADIQPAVLVDAILAKQNLGTTRDMAPLTIGLGPGFTAGVDVDIVVETNRGHNLGRLIYEGSAEPNTGVPGNIGGFTIERVVYSPRAGVFKAIAEIGAHVEKGHILGMIVDGAEEKEVLSPLTGVLRGLLRTGTPVGERVKVGDVDPRAKKEYCYTISEKARSIGGAVLLAVREWEV